MLSLDIICRVVCMLKWLWGKGLLRGKEVLEITTIEAGSSSGHKL
jgi:hypothetical protein